jgi:hypothetical protein
MTMNPLGALLSLFWAVSVGAVALYLFFLALGAIAADDVAWMSIAAGVLALFAVIHFVRVRRALADHHHEEMALAAHRMRERRGF